MANKEWPLWEVFIRSKKGLIHKHVGSLIASDSQMAIKMQEMFILEGQKV